MSADRASEFRLAVSLLSRLPAGTIRGNVPAMAASAWAWPLVGAIVGAIAAVVASLALGAGLPPIMAALLVLAAGALATGGMHEDGLADVADGFGGGRDRGRKLEIMRDSRIGSYGVLALVLATGFRAAGIAAVAGGDGLAFALIGVGAASRAGLPLALCLMPPARSDGLGHAAAGQIGPARAALVIGILFLLPLGLGIALWVALVMTLSVLVLAGLAMRQIGGQTGDVMGAMQIMAECAGWAVLAVYSF
jgi:adenosylcobinamide-GDP ribazoletransferase